MSARYLNHVTLTTGHTRRSYRDEVADDTVAYCGDLIEDVLRDDGARHALHGISQYSLTATATARNLLAVIWRGEDRVVTIGIGLHSRAASLWRLLIETAQTPIHPNVTVRPPAEPWLAARLEPACVQCTPEVLMMIGDFERCVGWAWMERTEARRAAKA